MATLSALVLTLGFAPRAEPGERTAGTARVQARPAAPGGASGSEADLPVSGVIGGVHDFSNMTGRFADACSACHVPHVQAVRPVQDGSRSDPPSDDTVGTSGALELYRIEGQRQVFLPGRYMPGATSLICLSCHNGTIAASTMGTSHALLSGERFGFGVSDDFTFRDHPIGIPYPVDPKEYHPRAFVEKKGIPLPEGRIECISCHDPHDEKRLDAMLVMSNRRSALCLTCHKK